LKVFWLKKYSEEAERSMYRSYKPPKNIAAVTLKDNSSFSCLTITNPKDSNCIYTLHDLQFASKAKRIMRILGSDELVNPKIPLGVDKLLISRNLHPNVKFTELASDKNNVNLFANNYAIILPGGSLIVEIEDISSEVDLNINWSVEEF
jgi:hypothetical protein